MINIQYLKNKIVVIKKSCFSFSCLNEYKNSYIRKLSYDRKIVDNLFNEISSSWNQKSCIQSINAKIPSFSSI